MLQKYPAFLVTIISFYMCSLLFAEGSFSFDDELQPILNSIPETKSYVLNHYSFASSGWANRIGNNVNPRFGGRRLGPYTIPATANDTTFTGEYEISFVPITQYRDIKGWPTTLENAFLIKEILKSVHIKATNPKTTVQSYRYVLDSFVLDYKINLKENYELTGTDRLSGQHHFRIICYREKTLSIPALNPINPRLSGTYPVNDVTNLLRSKEFLESITHIEIVFINLSLGINKFH
jgi:hypothetical protein